MILLGLMFTTGASRPLFFGVVGARPGADLLFGPFLPQGSPGVDLLALGLSAALPEPVGHRADPVGQCVEALLLGHGHHPEGHRRVQ